MTRKRRVENLVSAGGVVYRNSGGEPEVVLCRLVSPPLLALPKGTPDEGESREQTALREVSEETGLEVEIERFIDTIDYWFVRSSDGVRCHKTVLYYLMSPTGGDVSLHDHEFDDVRWLPATRAFEAMTYEDEVEVVRKGLSMVEKAARAG